ncbi:MAG: acyl-CoA dehydratase activase [Acidobacteriia bacterium]|nr:acyl-CoA dehydratase activase [Terriglobia bacterium]
MNLRVGLDIGASSLKLAALCSSSGLQDVSEQQLPEQFLRLMFPSGSPQAGKTLLVSRYRRIQGNPLQSAYELLLELQQWAGANSIHSLRVTGSGGRRVANLLGCGYENEFRALAKGVRSMYPGVRTIFEMGGASSRYLRLDPADASGYLGIVDYQSSGDCAAGTGSFMDQQASRLRYSVEEAAAAACVEETAARVAGRCSVFAKTDMIHAQQRGYTTGQILRGLCEAIARNFKSSIVRGRPVVAPVLFVGGVAMNEAVQRAVAQVFRLKPEGMVHAELPYCLSALGAALVAADDMPQTSVSIGALQLHELSTPEAASSEPLSLENVRLLRREAVTADVEPATAAIEAYLGIDVGSVSTNLVVINAAGQLLKEIYLPTAGRPIEVVNDGLQEIQEELGTFLDIRGVGTTGSGRELIGELVGADTVNDEITAHKTGAVHVCHSVGTDLVDTIFEIGGQDSKFIRLDGGIVVDFTMNEACAAGTGSFLEEQAEKLGISIKGEFAQLALASQHPSRLGERCTVFMDRDLTAALLDGAQVGDLCAGLAYSVAMNYLNRVVRGRKIGNVIYFQGGTAYNDAVAAAFAKILGKPIIVPPHNGVIGAIGMALLARDRMMGTSQRSRFRGYDLNRVDYTSRDFVCRACSNDCDMKEFVIEGQKTYWGDKCSDKFRKRTRTDREPVIADLLEVREKLLLKTCQPEMAGERVVGIPRAMFFYDSFPFWSTYLQGMGCRIVLSSATDGAIAARGEELAIAQPCFPVQVAHGHVEALVKAGAESVFVPNVVNMESPTQNSVESYLCPWNQTLPFVLRAAAGLADVRERLLAPTVHFRLGRKAVRGQLRSFAREQGWTGRRSDEAAEAAYAAQAEFQQKSLLAGREALQQVASTGEPAIVLVGRAYNLYDRSMNCDIPRKLRSLYGVNVIPLDFIPTENEDISSIHSNMFWNSGRLILAAAKFTARDPNLHVMFISNFKCGPDSYIKLYLRDAAGKPALFLQFDAHSNDAGYLTRCEAYLDSKGFLGCPSSTTIPA